MKVIVPVDFSEIALNAAEFTAQMFQGKFGVNIVLYHMFKEEGEATLVYKNLEWLKETYEFKYKVNVSCKAELGDHLINCLTRLARFEEADLVVMAVTHRNKIVAESFSLQMIAQSLCPVLVVPPNFTYQDVKNVAIACDFKDAERLIPLPSVKKILQLFKPNLHIVNVNNQIQDYIEEGYIEKRNNLQKMFEEFHPEFHFINTAGFHETMLHTGSTMPRAAGSAVPITCRPCRNGYNN
jgi:nucleotide-binding universal stress UspA family protein